MAQFNISVPRESHAAAGAPGRAHGCAARFARSEEGSILVFGLMLFILMLMLGGFAVDVMSFEAKRTDLQQAVDRCALTAAALAQTRDPEEVVEDCMLKAGKAEYVTLIDHDEGLNYREVVVTAQQPTKPLFAHMLGIDGLTAPAATKAEQKVTNVEIVMVLDVSGSMVRDAYSRPTDKLKNLKAAAKEFVDTMLAKDLNHRISIAIVPYNGQVNLGKSLRQKFNTYDNNGVTYMDCVDMPASVYASTGLSRTLKMPMTANADTFSAAFSNARTGGTPPDTYSGPKTSEALPTAGNRWCLPTAANVVRLPSGSISSLQASIDGLEGNGATSINAGMKVGLSLLDPSARPLFAEFVGSGEIQSYFHGRPFDYTDEEVMKVMIVMTDGEHFEEERVNDGYRVGESPIYRSSDGEYLSLKLSNGKFYWPYDNTTTNTAAKGKSPTQLTWQQVWASYRTSYIAWQLYSRRPGFKSSDRLAAYTAQMNAFRTLTPISTMDAQLQALCNLAKSNNVTIFGIAFEAPANGKTQIQNCSTSRSSHYFDASGLEIQTAFRAIASQISYLRLSQ
ncbi:vWA domain-containing protein [Cereibacter sediminicola]|uniref:vWA domain-containing protein n=1 Tax=Cereibacter sediminicola TaxID=2584941 RepID=UPI001642B0AF|nr:vWA domain-containing protein [Cereibacter sediminicola]